jgi:hypothetical protein
MCGVCVCERERDRQRERKEVRTKLLKSFWTKAMKFADHDWGNFCTAVCSFLSFVSFANSFPCSLLLPFNNTHPPLSNLLLTTVAIKARGISLRPSVYTTASYNHLVQGCSLYVAVGNAFNVFQKYYILILELELRDKDILLVGNIHMCLRKT